MDISEINKINLNNSKVAVLGLGRSGQGAAHLANYLGANVIVSDNNINSEITKRSKKLVSLGIEVELGQHTKNILSADLWIISPGISQKSQIFLDAKSNGIPIISEIEFASWFANHPIISVTGSNGKTTTVSLIHQMCNSKLMNPKLGGNIGCMVNGAGLAMATLDIIKLYGSEPANFLDVGGGASKEKVSAAFKIILSDKNVEGILINIFGGIMRCDVLAQGVVDAAKEINLSVPLVVRLAGTNVDLGNKILKESNLKIISANNLSEAAKKIIEVTN